MKLPIYRYTKQIFALQNLHICNKNHEASLLNQRTSSLKTISKEIKDIASVKDATKIQYNQIHNNINHHSNGNQTQQCRSSIDTKHNTDHIRSRDALHDAHKVVSTIPTTHPYIDHIRSSIFKIAPQIPYSDLDNTIIYDGNPTSKIMIIGEAPGADEVIHKKPFVGQSGQLLQKMLNAAGLSREYIYITNVMPWRPPMNRPPMPSEIDIMRPVLIEHIQYIKPIIMILVGSIAFKAVINSSQTISKARGNIITADLCSCIIPTFHPSFLLRAPVNKQYVWRDIMYATLIARQHNLPMNSNDSCLNIDTRYN